MDSHCAPGDRLPSWRVRVLTVGAIAVLTAFNVSGRYAAGRANALLVLDIAVGVVACALILMLFFRPVAGGFALAALAALSPGATAAATMATYQVARRRPFVIAATVAGAGVAGHLVQGLWRPIPGISLFWWIFLDVAVHACLLAWGALTQARKALLESLRERARTAEAEQVRRVAEARTLERTRMAREMHDVLAHRLSLLATYAGALEYRPDSSPEQLARAAGVVRSGVHQALEDLREVIGVLRDGDLAEQPGGGPQPTLADLERLIAESRDAGTDVIYDGMTGPADSLPPATGRTAYRIVQEGLTNARKHAGGQPVQVSVSGRPGRPLVIEIRNRTDGRPTTAPGSGTGLVGLTERVQLAGGTLDHRTADGRFVLRASLPWPA